MLGDYCLRLLADKIKMKKMIISVIFNSLNAKIMLADSKKCARKNIFLYFVSTVHHFSADVGFQT